MSTGLFNAIGGIVALAAIIVLAVHYRRRELREDAAVEPASRGDAAGEPDGGPSMAQGVLTAGQPQVSSTSADNRIEVPDDVLGMLAKPEFMADPVYPEAEYLQAFGAGCFRALLRRSGQADLVERVCVLNANPQSAMLLVDHFAFWAIDLEAKPEQGLSGREEFVERVRTPIRRPPPGMAAFTAEQHILAKGVAKIQVESGLAAEGLFQVCQLKTVGWCMAVLMSPRAGQR